MPGETGLDLGPADSSGCTMGLDRRGTDRGPEGHKCRPEVLGPERGVVVGPERGEIWRRQNQRRFQTHKGGNKGRSRTTLGFGFELLGGLMMSFLRQRHGRSKSVGR